MRNRELDGVSGIYAIVNRASGKLYVGSAVNIAKRWRLHRSHLSRNHHHSRQLQNAWNKYGEDAFAFAVVRFCPVADLIPEEQRWLDETEATGRHGYNTSPTAGSVLGVKRTPETRAKVSAALKGKKCTPETRAKIRAANLGKKLTPEHIANSAAGNKGRKRTPEARANMVDAQRKRAAANKGRKHTPETRANMAVARKGKKHTPEHRANLATANRKRAAANKAAKLARMSTVQGELFP